MRGDRTPVRVLVTGSRDWPRPQTVYMALWGLHRDTGGALLVVHGACPTGADSAASEWCRATRCGTEEKRPADWEKWGKSAGPIRNQRMVNDGADVCLAFIKDNSRGATGCAGMAFAAGIDTRIWRM
ncbi:SLOG family protein [Streptomyces johnsoniae]|uniref:SLOG family protein n=1 Tax=Streptomyces johnsoniae TaxID=3075532 RepID=A0ABU2S038_9ACTN|nr:SLOG family protein [Streptomyces sp. DSM 41886]MDT0442347.1 SLOG family protein [Streptomyces sp. DSM 41886]